jgi:hypothetical protein
MKAEPPGLSVQIPPLNQTLDTSLRPHAQLEKLDPTRGTSGPLPGAYNHIYDIYSEENQN